MDGTVAPRSANLNFPRIYSSAPNFEEVLIPNPTFKNNIKNCSKLDRINNRVEVLRFGVGFFFGYFFLRGGGGLSRFLIILPPPPTL